MTDGYLVNVQFKDGKTSSFYATYDGEWYYFMQDKFYRIKVEGINVKEQEYRNYLDNSWYPVKLMSSAQVIQFGSNYVDQADKRLQEQITSNYNDIQTLREQMDTVIQRINNLSEIVSGINQLVSDLTNKVNGNTAAIKNINNTINNVIIPELSNKVDASKYDWLCKEFVTLVSNTINAKQLINALNNVLKYLGSYAAGSGNHIRTMFLMYPRPSVDNIVPDLLITDGGYQYSVQLSDGRQIGNHQERTELVCRTTPKGDGAYYDKDRPDIGWSIID